MDLFDFFFPEQAQASHLRKIANKRSVPVRMVGDNVQASEIESLKDDVGFLTLIIAAMLRRLSETETLSLADVQDLLGEIDGLDGVANGGLAPGVLRGLLGVLKTENETPAEGNDSGINIVTTPRYRK